MKIINIIGILGVAAFAAAAISCAEDKVYDLGAIEGGADVYETGRVNFTAVNLAIPDSIDSATSYLSPDYNSSEDRFQEYLFSAYNPYYGGSSSGYEEFGFTLYKMSEMWSGGYNDIRIEFKPSSPAENSATFTMPDGTTHIATAENPTFIWTPDSLMKNAISEYIVAESHYTIDGNAFRKIGYIHINFNPDLIHRGQWYIYPWMNGQSINFPQYLSFTAENLTSTFPYPSQSMYDFFKWSIIDETMSTTIPYINSYGYQDMYRVTCGFNNIYVCGNTDIMITAFPLEDANVYLHLPPEQSVVLTKDNPTYTWHVSRELAESLSKSSEVRDKEIYGGMTYNRNGITYNAYGQINLIINPNLWYDEENKVFRYGE